MGDIPHAILSRQFMMLDRSRALYVETLGIDSFKEPPSGHQSMHYRLKMVLEVL